MNLAQDEITLLNNLCDKQRALMLLISQPGWKVFTEDFVKKYASTAYSYAMAATSGTEMGKHLGAYNTLEQITLWPEEEVARLGMQIRAIETTPR